MLFAAREWDSGVLNHGGISLFVKKLSSWFGSILFHALLVLFILYWFVPDTNRSTPGDRNAIGTIAIQSGGGAGQRAGILTDTETTDAKIAVAKLADLSNITSVLPPPPVIAPGLLNTPSLEGDSAMGMAQSSQGGNGSGSGSGSGGIGTGVTTVQIFGTQGKGKKFMYVFDRSYSMTGERIRKAKEALISSLDSLDDVHQFNIVFYNDEYHSWQSGRRLINAAPTEKLSAVRFVGGITAVGGTNHYPPLKEAIDHRPDVIFFLTDGDSQDDPTLRLSEIARANSAGRRVQINVIQFGSGGLTDAPSKTLQQLAVQNNGEYKYVNVTDWR